VRLPELSRVDPRRTQTARRLEARLRAGLGPVATRIAEGMPTDRKVRRRRFRLERQRAKLAAQRAELARLERELRQAGREEGDARGAFLKAAAAFTPYVVAEAKGTRYVINPEDKFSAQLFIKQHRREIRMLARAQQALEEMGADRGRHTLLEVGANIGTGAIEAIHRHGFERVLAFEPEPENFRLLRMNAILNGVEDRVETIEAAVSDSEGTATLQVSSRNSGAHSLSGGDVRAIGTVEVPTVTFDGMVGRGELDPDSVSLLWMDIEGYEIHALMGARTLVERAVPVVMELNPAVLEAAGRADRLLPTLVGDYTHVMRLRDLGKGDERNPFRPIEAIAGLLEESRAKVTDVLVCRLPDASRAGTQRGPEVRPPGE
jgi:FkbM family methyltransferase